MSAEPPVLIACSHGTNSGEGQEAVAQLGRDIAALRPGLGVLPAFVDVQEPNLPEVVARLAGAGQRGVVVPLLLSAGYHVQVDVRRAVAAHPDLIGAAAALGPDPVLVDVLEQRLTECGYAERDTLVLGAAGSSDPAAVAAVEQVARDLSGRLGLPVTAAFVSAAEPEVGQVVAAAAARLPEGPVMRLASGSIGRLPGTRPEVIVASYLLAPGFFARQLRLRARQAGADRVSAPLAPHPALARLALRRYDDALAGR